VIEVRDLVVRYGVATALDGVTLTVGRGEMVALVGPNGAGKTTLVDTLAGLVRPAAGLVRVTGRLAAVPEGRQLFGELTVEDNLRLGAWRSRDRDPARVLEALPGLVPLRHRLAGSLSGGEQQQVAVGRALMCDPEVLVVDELSLGLAPKVTAEIVAHLQAINQARQVAVLLIEQNVALALSVCARAYVLEAGRVVAQGPSRELAGAAAVADAYLGGAPTESGGPA
jgi:branched-chain amino acid transport system ATP-binding protein